MSVGLTLTAPRGLQGGPCADGAPCGRAGLARLPFLGPGDAPRQCGRSELIAVQTHNRPAQQASGE